MACFLFKIAIPDEKLGLLHRKLDRVTLPAVPERSFSDHPGSNVHPWHVVLAMVLYRTH
ncbi:hypothetical protein L210DRAFT_978115 [Boletus edulis BED1]|uniref:Uncharacterized protein n=1 Tax=Boletus edulis BED1 TaxID=1328754 RepID=A0AAD4C5C7_BOLED|nr:hypothetical protein L210DRAFT_978115 [Boletus edulis BED1]